MKDCFNRDLKVGDEVAMIIPRGRKLVPGVVDKVTPKGARIRYKGYGYINNEFSEDVTKYIFRLSEYICLKGNTSKCISKDWLRLK